MEYTFDIDLVPHFLMAASSAAMIHGIEQGCHGIERLRLIRRKLGVVLVQARIAFPECGWFCSSKFFREVFADQWVAVDRPVGISGN